MDEAHRKRATHVAKLEKLLDVAGTTTAWEEIARSLHRMPVRVLIALIYRIERTCAAEREAGERTGKDGHDL